MDFVDRLDPELAAVLEQMLAALTADLHDSPNVSKEDHVVQGPAGAPEVSVRIYRPVGVTGSLPCLFWIHGGGMVLGNLSMDDYNLQHVVEAVGCVAVSVEYRLAPEHPFPAPMEDC